MYYRHEILVGDFENKAPCQLSRGSLLSFFVRFVMMAAPPAFLSRPGGVEQRFCGIFNGMVHHWKKRHHQKTNCGRPPPIAQSIIPKSNWQLLLYPTNVTKAIVWWKDILDGKPVTGLQHVLLYKFGRRLCHSRDGILRLVHCRVDDCCWNCQWRHQLKSQRLSDLHGGKLLMIVMHKNGIFVFNRCDNILPAAWSSRSTTPAALQGSQCMLRHQIRNRKKRHRRVWRTTVTAEVSASVSRQVVSIAQCTSTLVNW